MNRDSNRRVEEMLRSGAAGARRDPSPDLRAGIDAALDHGAPGAERKLGRSSDRAANTLPVGRRAWRGRIQDVLVAAVVLAAIGLWGFAFLREVPKGSPASAPVDNTAQSSGNGEAGEEGFARERSSPSQASEAIGELARATPRTLHTAIDGSLLAELGNIAHDATRAAQFLVGRVPAPLVMRATEDTPH